MRKIALLAAFIAAAPLGLAPMPAAAQAQAAASGGQHVIVNGDRRVCRQVRRTATHMGGGRICRTTSEWSNHPGGPASAGSYDDIGDAYFKGMGTFERCPYDQGGAPQTALGPR
jgi:hypothetical protein